MVTVADPNLRDRYRHLLRGEHHVRLGLEDELGITELHHFRQVKSGNLSRNRNALFQDGVENPVENEAEGEHEAHQSCATNELRHQLAAAVVPIEQAGYGTVHTVPRSAIVAGAVGKESDGEYTPQSVRSMYRDGAHRIVNFEKVLDKRAAEADEHAGDQADDGCAKGADKAAGRGDGNQTRQQTVAAHRGVGLAFQRPHIEDGAEGSGASGEHGVDGDGADAQVAGGRGGEGAARVEAEPTKGQNEAADQHGGNIVADNGIARSIAIELADAGTDNHGHCQSCYTAHRVHHARSGKVAVAFPKASIDAQLLKPAAAPCPVAVERIGKGAHQDRGNSEGEELPAFGAGARHDGQGRIHEDHLEQEDDHHANIVGAPGEEHTAFAEDAPMGAEQREHVLSVQ